MATLRINLPSNLRELPGFVEKLHSNSNTTFVFKGRPVYTGGEGVWHTIFYHLDETIPDGLTEIMIGATIHDSIYAGSPHRECGRYIGEAFGDSIAEVEGFGIANAQDINIKGTDIQKMLALRLAIKAGRVRPTESWEQPQLGKPASELQAEFATAVRELDATKLQLKSITAKRDELAELLRQIILHLEECKTLFSGFWPLVTRRRVRKTLLNIIPRK